MSSQIELIGLSKRYDRQKKKDAHALRHINLKVEKGDVFGVIGMSGAGKTTLLRCLSTLDKPSLGKIFFNGEEISALSEKELIPFRQKMGLVFQHFNLFSSRSVEENVAFPLEIAGIEREEQGRRVSELLGLVGLSEHRYAYPAQLSGGQKQRVGIARALANDPHLLLCDEPTSALDPQTTGEILALLRDLKKKLDLTIVLITHEMSVVKEMCNKVAVLEQGEIVEMGNVATIFGEPKHPITKKLVLKTVHEIPSHLLSGKGKVLHLHFRGKKADQPVITQMVKKFQVDANILLGWIDSLEKVTIGNLIIELTGQAIEEAIQYLRTQDILVEEVSL